METLEAIRMQVVELTGSNQFDYIQPRRDNPALTYIYVPDQKGLGLSIVKIVGELPAQSPRIRGAKRWAQRKAGRQVTIRGSRIILMEEPET